MRRNQPNDKPGAIAIGHGGGALRQLIEYMNQPKEANMTQPSNTDELIEDVRKHLDQPLMRFETREGLYNDAAEGKRLIRLLLEERERLNKENEDLHNDNIRLHAEMEGHPEQLRFRDEELQQTREELEQLRESRDYAEMSAADAIAERNDVQTELEQVKTELAAKDKVLEWYASDGIYTVLHIGCSSMAMADRGEHARSILSQYKGADTDET